mgnify:CR=1 FL=1
MAEGIFMVQCARKEWCIIRKRERRRRTRDDKNIGRIYRGYIFEESKRQRPFIVLYLIGERGLLVVSSYSRSINRCSSIFDRCTMHGDACRFQRNEGIGDNYSRVKKTSKVQFSVSLIDP